MMLDLMVGWIHIRLSSFSAGRLVGDGLYGSSPGGRLVGAVGGTGGSCVGLLVTACGRLRKSRFRPARRLMTIARHSGTNCLSFG